MQDPSLQTHMATRREAVRLLGSTSAAAWLAATQIGLNLSLTPNALAEKDDSAPPLAPGDPKSPERTALIEAFNRQSKGLDRKFEPYTQKGDWVMPYRLFRPEAAGGKLPLVVYLHGSGGLGDDNLKQLAFGNVFGTRVWLLPENQRRFPCYVLAPQTDRGWARYDLSHKTEGPQKVLPGVGEGTHMALDVIDAVRHKFAIDEGRIYVMGQSMGGAGVWNMIASRPEFFAAAVICCGSESSEVGSESIPTPLWDFQGGSDQTVPVSLARDRIATRRKAGGHPLYSEYAGVDHNVWEWAFTEPALPEWLFSHHRS